MVFKTVHFDGEQVKDNCGCIPEEKVNPKYKELYFGGESPQFQNNCEEGFVPIVGWVIGISNSKLDEDAKVLFEITNGHQLFLWYEQVNPVIKFEQDSDMRNEIHLSQFYTKKMRFEF